MPRPVDNVVVVGSGAAGLGGRILDQDTATLGRVQRGLAASVRNVTTLARYQEIRIRHFHQVLGEYVDGG